MLILLVACWLLTFLYLLLMIQYARGWNRVAEAEYLPHTPPGTKISVIIPARNERANIMNCLQSILRNNYPAHLLEVIVVDDHSTDKTAALVAELKHPNVRCIRLEEVLSGMGALNSYKKKALEAGIAHSSGELILTTDADCVVPDNWLQVLVQEFERSAPVMIAAPVVFWENGKFSGLFQQIDFMTLQGITAASWFLRFGYMCNGANLAFSREAFDAVGGYRGIDHLASGDDLLLMMKMAEKFPGRIAYVKAEQATVATAPQPGWGSFFSQRVRWASKSGKYKDHRLTAVLLLVYLFNLSFPVLFLAGFTESFFWLFLLGMLFLKTAAELYFLLPVAAFFGKTKTLRWFPLMQPIHIGYIIAAGFLGMIGNYSWKGRRVR